MNTEPIYGRLDMTYLLHEKFYGSLGIKIPFVEREAQGEPPLLITDAADNKELLSFIVYGKSIQQTTTGAQLFVSKKSQGSQAGMTLTQKDDGGWHLEGTCTADNFRNIRLLEPTEYFTLPSGDYTLSFTGAIPDSVTLSIAKVANVNKQNEQWTILGSINKNKRNIVISLDGTEEALSMFVAFPNQVALSFDFYVMLNAGDTVLPWEPYTGGNPSPSPEYKQEPVSSGQSGQIKIDVLGGNLLSKEDLKTDISNPIDGVQYTMNSDGSVTVKGTADSTSTVYYKNIIDKLNDGETYYYESNSNGSLLIRYSDGTPNDYLKKVIVDKKRMTSISPYIQFLTGKQVDRVIYPILNVGSSALPFEPYKQPQTIILTTPNGLSGIPVSGDDYTYIDSTGQKWIADTIEYRKDGKCVRVQRIGKETIVGGFNVVQTPDVPGRYYNSKNILKNTYKDGGSKSMCNIATWRVWSNEAGDVKTNNWFALNGRNMYFTPKGNVADWNAEKVNNLLNGIPSGVTVLGQLANYIETQLTPEEIAAFKALHTNKPTTTIMNDAGAWTRIGYYGK